VIKLKRKGRLNVGELFITLFCGGTLILNGIIGMLFLNSMESSKKSVVKDSIKKVGEM
jgi:hypothetical protein